MIMKDKLKLCLEQIEGMSQTEFDSIIAKKGIDNDYYFILGYAYCLAKNLKSELKCYEDWNISEIMQDLFTGLKL
ncbi:UNVERIFIED_ORG: hypothetical protein B2H93_04375 [Clostridium botulinum]